MMTSHKATLRKPPPFPRGLYFLMTETTISPKANGPLVVKGPVRIVTPDGRELPVPPRKDGRPAEVVVLCRCGGAAAKTFYERTHKQDGEADPAPARPPHPPLARAGEIVTAAAGGDPGRRPAPGDADTA